MTIPPHILRGCISVLMALTATAGAQNQRTYTSPTPAELAADFLHPPADSRPMVRWWWFGPAVAKAEILREIKAMQAAGIGGAELAFVYPLQLQHNEKFLSPEMLDNVRYAQTEGRKLGLRIDVTLCSGWPYGGPHITLDLAASRLRTYEVPLPAGATAFDLPQLAGGESILAAQIVEGQPKHWSSANRKEISVKSGDTRVTVDTATVPRVALIFVASHTRQQVKRPALGAEGYVLDPFSHDAVATHLKAVGEPLLSAFGETPPYAIFSDSLEAFGADWTPALPSEFARRRGYDLLPHLAELVAGDTSAATRVRHDYGITLTELINENYLMQINAWAHAHHTRFRSQTYGEPAVSFSSERLVDLAEGEGSQWRAFSTLRWATSANHVFGNPITSGETFTWLHSPVFRATPLDMKAEADVDFLSGENQLIFHGWPYSPPPSALPAGDPGWSLYAAAALNDHNPWFPVMPAVTSYITRISYLLRQGEPANQVAVLLPTDDAWANFIPGKVTVTGAMDHLITHELMSTILSAGYNVDFIDADAIRSTGLGAHQIVLVPPTDRIPLDTLRALSAFASRGGKVVAVGKLPSLDADSHPLPFDPSQLSALQLVSDMAKLPAAMHAAIPPDLQLSEADTSTQQALGFIRRKLPDADVYFVANTSNQTVHASLGFNTRFPHGQRWSAETGRPTDSAAASRTDIALAPYESATFVFSANPSTGTPVAQPATTQVADLSTDWHLTFLGTAQSLDEHTLTDWGSTPATLHYSGEVDYRRDVDLPRLPGTPVFLAVDGGAALPGSPDSTPAAAPLPDSTAKDGMPNPLVTHTGPGMHAFYDPPIREAALVLVNGHDAGALWHPPFRLDITSLLRPGRNTIELRVFNTALNAWSAAPKRDYAALKTAFGDRFQMQDLDQVKPLPSGVLGSIHLVTESSQ